MRSVLACSFISLLFQTVSADLDLLSVFYDNPLQDVGTDYPLDQTLLASANVPLDIDPGTMQSTESFLTNPSSFDDLTWNLDPNPDPSANLNTDLLSANLNTDGGNSDVTFSNDNALLIADCSGCTLSLLQCKSRRRRGESCSVGSGEYHPPVTIPGSEMFSSPQAGLNAVEDALDQPTPKNDLCLEISGAALPWGVCASASLRDTSILGGTMINGQQFISQKLKHGTYGTFLVPYINRHELLVPSHPPACRFLI